MIKSLLAIWVGLLGLAACANVTPDAYKLEQPTLDLKTYFNGTLDAWGIFQDRSGKVVKRFQVVINANWVGEVGTLDERFTYADGSTARRVWTITALGGGRYQGRADDVIGEAEGVASGNALRWRYVLALPVDDTVYHVNFDDWMFLMDDQVMLNRSAMSKFGFSLGEVTLSFKKRVP